MDPNINIAGGRDITVRKLDGGTESVFVRQVPIQEFQRLLLSMESEPALAEVFTARPQGWADTLVNESIEQVILVGEEINADFFSRWVQRRIARQEKLIPGITEKLAGAVALSSTNGSQTPQSAAG
jgi:hypothetical protein